MSGLTTRDALAKAIAPGAFIHEFRREVRASSGIPLGVACAQDEAFEIADKILDSGVIIDAATLDDDAELVRDVSARWGAEATYVAHNVQHVLRHLSAALSERTS